MKKEYILLGILVVILLAAGLWIFQIISEYQRADQEYEELREYVKEAEKEEQDQKEGESEKQEEEESGEAGSAEAFTVDFAALQQINPDIVAWLRIPGVLDYPVVQGTDNSYYLHHTFRKEYNIAGSIFLDARNMADFSDSKNIIYGHNMRNGSMFHVLRKFQDLDFYQSNREIWLYLPDGSVEVYEIVGCEEVKAAGEAYELGNGNEEEKELILSTCSSRSAWRVIVKGKLKHHS